MSRLVAFAPMALVVVFTLFLSSCTRWEIDASFDMSKDGEKGPSGETGHFDPGANIMLDWLDMISFGGITGEDAVKHDDYKGPWTPEYYYQAANKRKDGFGLLFTGGYIGKGNKGSGFTERLNYLEVSEALVYTHKTTGGLLYGGLGPYVAYGLGGKEKFNGGSEPVFTADGYKRFDAGIHFLGEYRLNSGLSLGLGYDLGIFDKSKDPSDYTSRNRTMLFEVGYSLDKIVNAIKGK
jgi:hypothetical protein